MKHLIKFLACTSLLMMALTFTSCQDEFEDVTEPNEQETITANSTTAKLVTNTAANDGSFDNIVDGASCFAVKFPYTVTVKGLDVTIDAIEDLKTIEELFDAVDDDIDVLEFIFPITVTLADFTEIVINGKEDLRAIAEECVEGGNDDDIECIDFVYPIKLYTFDINREQTGNVTVNSDKELRRFFAGLDDNDIVSIDFPVELELYDGTKTMVNNNEELAAAIERAKGMCDEDDDDDHNDDDFTKERLDNYLVQCPWLVYDVQRDNQSQREQYFEYVMNFTEDGVVKVKGRNGEMLTGTWNTRVSDFRVLLKLEFETLVDFTLDWFIYELEPGKIKLFAEGGNKIVMKKACDLPDTSSPDTLREVLKECAWIIQKVKLNNENIDRLLGLAFEFKSDGLVILTNGHAVSNGTWAITTNQEGKLVMAITMGDEPGVSFEWLLSDLRNKRLQFNIEGTNYELILERLCDDGDTNAEISGLRNVLKDKDWVVASYLKGEEDKTDLFEDKTISLELNNQTTIVNTSLGTPGGVGVWRVLMDIDYNLKVYLNFAGDLPFQGLITNDWKFVTASETGDRIELKHLNDDETYSIMVLERLDQ